MSRVWAFDIETDTTGERFDDDAPPPGLDPRVGAVTSAAFSGPSCGVFTGPERQVLDWVARWLANDVEEGDIVATWNGGVFDWPYLAHRFSMQAKGATRLFRLHPFQGRQPKYGPLPTSPHPVCAVEFLFGGCHLDVAYVWRDFAEADGGRWSLKSVADKVGLEAIMPGVTGADVADLDPAELATYNLSDADLTLTLALAWWEQRDDTEVGVWIDPAP